MARVRRQLRRWRRRLLRAAKPTRLRDTWVHRVLGERLFDPHLWVPSRETLAAGLAVGTFIALEFFPSAGDPWPIRRNAGAMFRTEYLRVS